MILVPVPMFVPNFQITNNFGLLFMMNKGVKTVSDNFINPINAMILVFVFLEIVGGETNTLQFFVVTVTKDQALKSHLKLPF